MNRSNPFLSEFRGRFQQILALQSYRLNVIFFPVVLALVTLVFGYFARNDALELGFQLTFKDRVVHDELKVHHIFGYLGEVNHAILYIFIAPLIIYLGLEWIKAASDSVNELAQGGVLIDVYGTSPITILSTYNRRRFRGVLDFFCLRKFRILFYNLLSVLLIVFTAKTFLTEVQSNNQTPAIGSVSWDQIGYTYSSSLAKWVEDFNKLPHSDQLNLLNDKKKFGPELETGLRSYLKAHFWLADQYPALITLNDPTLNITVRTAEVDDAVRQGNYRLNLLDALNSQLIFLEATERGSSQNTSAFQQVMLRFSLWIGWLNESFFQALLIWFVLKIMFFLALLVLLLPGNKRLRLRLKPDYLDPNFRYGFFPLFKVYNLTVLIIAVGGFMFNLMALNAITLELKDDTSGWNSFLGKILALSAITVLMAFLAGGPVLLFRCKLFKFKERLRERLPPSDPKHTTVDKQLTWPKDDKTFLGMLCCVFVFVLVPFGIHLTQLKDAEAWVSVPHWFYQLSQALAGMLLK